MNLAINKGIEMLDYLYTKFEIHDKISALLDFFETADDYSETFSYFASGVYFIFGKPLVIAFIGVVTIVLVIRISMAIINLIWP